MATLTIAMVRDDREPDEEYYYGDEIDKEINVITNNPEIINRKRKQVAKGPLKRITGKLKDFDSATVTLHEIGPEFEFANFLISKTPEIVAALSGLLTAWCAFRPQLRLPPFHGRHIRLAFGSHEYRGRPTPQQLLKIIEFFAVL